MALLDDLYIFVEDESVEYEAETTTHPVEAGVDLTDHLRMQPEVCKIKGKIVSYGDMDEWAILKKLLQLQKEAAVLTYIGRNLEGNMQIVSLNTSHPNTVWGGHNFDMTLKEVRIAQKSYVAQKKGGLQKVSTGTNTAVYHTVKKGDCVWNLVTGAYKSLDPKYSNTMDKCNWVMSQNPSAFSRQGDFTTLQIGKKILMGYRK